MNTIVSSILAIILSIILSINLDTVEAKQLRSGKTVREFKTLNPCPATGSQKGSCKGYIVDHIVPLCAGGKDAPSNMQWQTVTEAKLKDKEEFNRCKTLRNKSSGWY